MNKLLELLIYQSTTILAVGVGLVAYKKLDLPMRLIFWQVSLYLAFDLVGAALRPHNAIVYNIFMPIEMALLTLAAWVMLKEYYKSWVFIVAYLLFAAAFILDLSPGMFAYHSSIVEGLVTTFLYLLVLLSVLLRRIGPDKAIPTTLISLGHVLYFAGTAPYLCMLYYFHDKDPAFGGVLYKYFILLLALLRYLFIAIAFLFAMSRRSFLAYERT